MKKLILHIPHAATKIPIEAGFIISQKAIANEILKLTDWHTEDLYVSKNSERIVFEYSRIFCDPERFVNDAQEPMAKLGMGVLYDKTDNGKVMRVVTPALRAASINNYYVPHHKKLQAAVTLQLEAYGRALILDCHSFPGIPMKRSAHTIVPRPDFNIGTDAFHTPQRLIDSSITFFKERNLSLGVDYPFKGAIVPMAYYQKNKNVASIMLEVNRKLYLKKGSNEKSKQYDKTKQIVNDYIRLLENAL